MKGFTTPRLDAADLHVFFRARAIERMRRKADRAASLRRGLDREDGLRNRVRQADESCSFWVLYAR